MDTRRPASRSSCGRRVFESLFAKIGRQAFEVRHESRSSPFADHDFHAFLDLGAADRVRLSVGGKNLNEDRPYMLSIGGLHPNGAAFYGDHSDLFAGVHLLLRAGLPPQGLARDVQQNRRSPRVTFMV